MNLGSVMANSVTLKASVKRWFFDKPGVMNRVDRGKMRVLSRFGAFVRKSAIWSIRTRKKSSDPGQPPSSHTGTLKRFIYFAYEPSRDSVVIGPMKTNQVFFDGDGQPVTGTVPEVLEYGGRIRVAEMQLSDGLWRRIDLRSRRRATGRPKRLRTVQIKARPYMGPAFRKEQPKLPAMWRNSVK